MMKKVYEYELCVAHINPKLGKLNVWNINLSSDSAFSPFYGINFYNLGFSNIKVKKEYDIKTRVPH